MLYKKSLRTYVVFIIVALFLISSFVSIGISTKTNIIAEKSGPVSGNRLKVRIKNPEPCTNVNSPVLCSNIFDDFNNSENIIISDDEGDESYPTMIANGLVGLAAYQNEKNMRIYLRNTKDFGKTWSNSQQIEVYYGPTEPDIDVFSPDISFSPADNKVYGTYISPKNNQSVHGYFITSDIGTVPKTDTFTLDWSAFEFYNFTNSEIVTYENSTTQWVITFIGSTNYKDPDTGLGQCNDSVMFCFTDLLYQQYIAIVWFPEIQYCSNLSIAHEYGTSKIYGACEIKDDKYSDILFFKGNPDEWYYQSIFENESLSVPFTNLKHPHISVKGKEIYITAETEKDGLDEIILFYSFDDGVTWKERNVVTNQAPKADFDVTTHRFNATFSDKTSDDDGYITSWFWDFGDENTSELQNPYHEYSLPGDFTVTLTVKDDDNTENITSMLINIDNTTPIADFFFTPTYPEPQVPVYFTDASIPFENYTIDSWIWDFGDGSNQSYIQNPIHDYFEEGKYNVTLDVKNQTLNTSDSIQKTINVGFIADFTINPMPPKIEDVIWFNDTSTITIGKTIVNWTWDFGDGTGEFYMQNMTHQYTRQDNYQVNLTIRDSINEVRTIEKTVNVRSDRIIPGFTTTYTTGNILYCTYTEAKNIYLLNSTDDGLNWNAPLQLNSVNGSVVEEYHNAFIPDEDHVIWIDDRGEDNDIYSISREIPDVDLRIIPDSVELAKDNLFNRINTMNRIKFTVENNGATFVEQIRATVTIEFNDNYSKTPIQTSYPAYILRLDPGKKKTFDKPLFRFTAVEFLNALIDYAGIVDIAVTVDPDGLYEDSNTEDNTFRIPALYSMIFPILSPLENLFLINA
jgi:PKD repeat protein